jgi:hypothetical protein
MSINSIAILRTALCGGTCNSRFYTPYSLRRILAGFVIAAFRIVSEVVARARIAMTTVLNTSEMILTEVWY